MSKKHNIVTGIMMAGAMLAGGKEGNSQNTENTTKANITQVQHSTKNQIVDLDALDHQKIIKMTFEELLQQYGLEKGGEGIKKHMLIEINFMRKTFGLGALETNDILNATAQEYAQYCVENNHFDHYDLDDNTPTYRAKQHGYKKGVSENLFRGQNSGIDDAVQFWTVWSESHAKNIKNAQKYCGIGIYASKFGKTYAVLVLD